MYCGAEGDYRCGAGAPCNEAWNGYRHLSEIEMMARMAVLVEIARSRKLKSDQLLVLLDELSEKFMDFTALVMEMVMSVEGVRH